MKRIIAIGIVGMLLGAAIGTNVSRYFARQHEHTMAIMVLMQLHLKNWEQAVDQKECPVVSTELTALQFLANEIPVVLPKADKQDAAFHQHVVSMQQILVAPAIMQCAMSAKDVKQVRERCDECHREYR